MSKLFKLKEWLTISDAARHLSGVCGESVSEADVLRLGLDGHLKLSVDFVNKARAKLGSMVSEEDAERKIFARNFTDMPPMTIAATESEIPAYIAAGLQNGSLFTVVTDLHVKDGQFLHLEDKVESISGVWDLPLIGAERLDIEHLYQQMTGGPEVTLVQLDGAIVCRDDRTFAQLQESFDSPDMRAMQIQLRENNPNLAKLPTRTKSPNHADNYFPAGALPQDSVLVVRTSALTEFQSRIMAEPAPTAKESSQSTREKNNLLRIIGLMVNHRYAKDAGAPYTIAAFLTEKAKELSVKISDDAIAKHLKAALALIENEKSNPN